MSFPLVVKVNSGTIFLRTSLSLLRFFRKTLQLVSTPSITDQEFPFACFLPSTCNEHSRELTVIEQCLLVLIVSCPQVQISLFFSHSKCRITYSVLYCLGQRFLKCVPISVLPNGLHFHFIFCYGFSQIPKPLQLIKLFLLRIKLLG